MVYSSDHPLYHLDSQAINWHHQDQQQILLQAQDEETRCSSAPPPPSTCNEHVSGGDGSEPPMTGSINSNWMVDLSHQAQLLVLPEVGLKCPRCESTNTKFCYFNNYNLSQPRHFYKTCRRFWTRGGSLKNVPPVGGATSRDSLKQGAGAGGDGGALMDDGVSGGAPMDDGVSGGAGGALMDDGVPAVADFKIHQVD